MKQIVKTSILIMFFSVITLSCVNDDDYVIPTVKEIIFFEDFESITTGSGSNEVAINLDGWVNTNTVNTRVWSGKTFNSNKFAEFSSFYSNSGTTDETWLITKDIDLTAATAPIALSFSSVNRFYNGDVLKVYISNDYDGTIAGISAATWEELNPVLPNNSNQNDLTIQSGAMDISSYIGSNVRVAFKYTGSKTSNPTTTFQLDNVRIFQN